MIGEVGVRVEIAGQRDAIREAVRGDAGGDVVVRGGGAGEEQADPGRVGQRRAEGGEDLRQPFFRRQAPEAAEHDRVVGQPVARADRGARRPRPFRRERFPLTEADGGDGVRGQIERAEQFRARPLAVDRGQPRGRHQRPHHRPFIVEAAVEAGDGQFGGVRRHVRMVPAELGAVVGGPLLAEEESGAGMVEVCIVQHDEAGDVQRVGPLIIVMRGIAELVDRQVIGGEAPLPDEVVGRGLGIAIDGVPARRQGLDQLGAAPRDPRPDGRKRAEPG